MTSQKEEQFNMLELISEDVWRPGDSATGK